MGREVTRWRGTQGPAATKPARDVTSLDGETVILRKTERGYIL